MTVPVALQIALLVGERVESARENRCMTTYSGFRPKPEEEELRLKRRELKALEDQLVERELYLVGLKAELSAFERVYLRKVGVLYAELDEIGAQVAETRAQREPTDRGVQETAREARARAETTRATTTDIALSEGSGFSPSASLKSLYREVAKRIHPDLAADELDRSKRQRLMSEANKAYEEGDEARLREILEEYESSPDTVRGEGTAHDLVRVIRKIAQVRRRLREIETNVEEILESDLAQLKSQADEAVEEGRDLLDEMAESVRAEIRRAKEQLNELRRVHT